MSARGRDSIGARTVASHLGVIVAVSAVMGVLVAGLAVPVIGALGYGARTTADSLKNMPESLQAQPLPQRSRILDRHGKVVATFYDQNRVNVPLKQIAPVMRKAIVSIEDYRFYQHGAIDVKGTLRAFLTNQASGGTTQGGSSITQQMAKMTAVEQATTEAQRRAATADTYQRKITELRHAIAFEQHHSKNWILDRYLNIAYFGDGAYGIQAAARHYFGVDARGLDVRQASLLAGLVQNPTGYDPTSYPQRAKARRRVVLLRMAQLHVISHRFAHKVDGQGLGLHLTPMRNGCVDSKAPFYCDFVRRYLLADPSLGGTVHDREDLLNSGGLTIKTSLDLRFQHAADRATHSHVDPTDHAIGAIAMVQPGTGNVRAISQSRPMGRNQAKGQTFLNYVVPQQYGDSGGFQAGSTFKLFTLSAALQQGLPASTSFYSPAQVHIDQNEYRTCHGSYGSYGKWSPHNSTTNGTMSMVTGMQQSVNTFFAQLEKQTGLCMPYHLATKMGVGLSDPSREMVPSFTLGVDNVSPLEMAGAYATVASGGMYCKPHPVVRILNSAGDLFKRYPEQCKRVLARHTANTVNSILEGVMTGYGFGSGLALDKPSAGKTGTTDNNKAVWFDGYTPALAAASMVAGANQDGHPMSLNGQVVGGAYVATAHGSTTAGPMWADAMRAIEDRLPGKGFAAMPGDVSQAKLPSVTGMSIAAAKHTVRSDGLRPVVAGTVDKGGIPGSIGEASVGVDGHTVYLYPTTGHGGYVPPPPPPPPAPPAPPAPAPGPPSGGGGGGGGGGHHGGGGGGHGGGGGGH
ncbi:MAG: transglycosylase domain-containing protein, partial [Marmoricola sp.]